jgi:hypothetical protein
MKILIAEGLRQSFIDAKLRQTTQKESSFSEEKEAKRLLLRKVFGTRLHRIPHQTNKSLLLLFFRKEVLIPTVLMTDSSSH